MNKHKQRKIDNDYEGEMAKAQLLKIENYAKKLNQMIHPEDELEAWVQAKLSVIAAYMGDVKHYLDYQLKEAGQTLERDEIDDLLTQEYSLGGRMFKDTRAKGVLWENWGKQDLSPIYDNNFDLIADVVDYYKDLASSVSQDYASEMKAEMIKILQTGKHTFNDNSTITFKNGGETMYKVEPSSMDEDMAEARKIIGDKFDGLSEKDKKDVVAFLKFEGLIGSPGQEEDIETISGMQYYSKGGSTTKPTKYIAVLGMWDNNIESEDREDFIKKMSERGYEIKRILSESDAYSPNPIFNFSWKIGHPEFYGLIGPMKDGNKIRYETQSVYNTLST